MKTKLSLIVGGLFLLGQATVGLAAPTTFTVSATVPPASGVSIAVSQVSVPSNTFTTLPSGTTSLTFNPLTLNSSLGIYLPDHYFALDFGTTGGAGTADVTVTYNEGTNPNGTSTTLGGLGTKVTATFAKEVVGTGGTTTETLLTDHGPKKRLIDLNGEHIAYTEVSPGFPRIYLGVWTGSTTAPADPTNGQPFSNADAPGTYTGSLVVTAVVD